MLFLLNSGLELLFMLLYFTLGLLKETINIHKILKFHFDYQQQDGQCTYNVTFRCLLATIVGVEEQ